MITAPDPALAAAQRLRDQGHHVHLVASAEDRCLSGHCPAVTLIAKGRTP